MCSKDAMTIIYIRRIQFFVKGGDGYITCPLERGFREPLRHNPAELNTGFSNTTLAYFKMYYSVPKAAS